MFARSVLALTLASTTAGSRPIPLSPTWGFSNPEGVSTIENQSATGFDFTVADVRGNIVPDPDNPGLFLGRDGATSNAVRSRVYKLFDPLDMTLVRQAVVVSFDLELLDPFVDNNRADFHFGLFDTSTGYEMFPLVHIGPNLDRSDFIKFRIDPILSNAGGPFDPANVDHMAVGGQSRGPQTDHPGVPLADTGFIHTFSFRVERVTASTLSITTTWTYVESDKPNGPPLGEATWSVDSYNEATGVIDGEPNPAISDVWADGKVSQFDGFGFLLHDNEPFNSDGDSNTFDEGTLVVSQFTVDYTTPVHPPFQIIDVVRSGDDNVITWEALPGESYAVFTATTLDETDSPGGWEELDDSVEVKGTVGTFTDQGVDGAPHRFYQIRWLGLDG